MPTAACSKVARNRSSLSRRASSACFCSVGSRTAHLCGPSRPAAHGRPLQPAPATAREVDYTRLRQSARYHQVEKMRRPSGSPWQSSAAQSCHRHHPSWCAGRFTWHVAADGRSRSPRCGCRSCSTCKPTRTSGLTSRPTPTTTGCGPSHPRCSSPGTRRRSSSGRSRSTRPASGAELHHRSAHREDAVGARQGVSK